MKKAKKALALLLCMIIIMSSLYVSGNLSFLTDGLKADAQTASEKNFKNSKNEGEGLTTYTVNPPPQFTPETYDVAGAKAADTFRRIKHPDSGYNDYFDLRYSKDMYLEINETLQGVGYKYYYDGGHYGGNSTSYRIILSPALWGGEGSFTTDKTFVNNINDYGVIADKHENWDGENGWGTSSGNRVYVDRNHDNGASEYENVVFSMQGSPKNVGDFTYKADSTGHATLGEFGWWSISWKTGRRIDAVNDRNFILDRNNSPAPIELTLHVYNKDPLRKAVNNVEAFKVYTEDYYSLAVNRSKWDMFNSGYANADLSGSKEILRTREVTQSEIDAKLNGFNDALNAANGMEFKAPSQKLRALKRFAEDAEATIAAPDFESKYTAESKQNLKDALNAAKADPVYSMDDTTVYRVDINNPDTLDSAYKAYAEQARIINYTNDLREAKEALKTSRSIDARIFKYGYNSNADGLEKYAAGGQAMNLLAIEKAKKVLNDSHRAEIEAILDNAVAAENKTWTQSARNTAVDNAIDRYANLYSIAFAGNPVTGKNAVQNNGMNAAWNVWCKRGTQAQGENSEEGASVQGLASSNLLRGAKGEYYFTTHAVYDEIPYDNPTDNGASLQPDKFLTFDCGNGNVTAALPALQNMSVISPDLFKAEALDVNGNPTENKTGEFAKYYWDTALPLDTVVKQGTEFYEYNSTSNDYFLQTKFDDANRTAQMSLVSTPNGWNVNGPASGRGFFPFNYQNSTDNFTNENAVYHYGLTFDTDFYIPQSGKYENNEDIVFEFTGDDDVYVYIDDVLVLDNGGLHGARKSSINFTDMSLRYQYIFDITKGNLKTEPRAENSNDIIYKYGETNNGISADNRAALEKLHEVRTDGDVHTLTFFFLERGAGSSNFDLSFNLKELSKNVKIKNQSYAVDYGSPMTANLRENDFKAEDYYSGNILYYGITAPNTPVNHEKIVFGANEPSDIKWKINRYPYEFETENVKYSLLEDGKLTIELKSMNMSEPEYFYVVTRIFLDSSYPNDEVTFRYEKVTIVPAASIYYEDNKNITYTDGKVAGGTIDETSGKWTTVGTQNPVEINLSSLEERIYGTNDAYAGFNTYSAGSAHSVTVSARNNPQNDGAAWPEAKFTFTGTGFDLISLTSRDTGAVKVTVKNTATGEKSAKIVDTFYGYTYSRIYVTPENEITSAAQGNRAVYNSPGGKFTTDPTYYDENGKVIKGVGDNPAYAYTWFLDSSKTEPLYQIPIIKFENLEYAAYEVTLVPIYTGVFAHNGSDYDFVLDAVRVYNPVNETVQNETVIDKYNEDNENNPVYIKLNDKFIGAEELDKTVQNGSVIINAEVLNSKDLETYLGGCPKNELYLNHNNAISFEIWADEIPQSVQIQAKALKGTPALSIAYKNMAGDKVINTASTLYYKLNDILPSQMQLTWTAATDESGKKVFKTEPVTIENTGDADSIISLTNLKLTFKNSSSKAMLKVNDNTAQQAKMAVDMLVSDLKLNNIKAEVKKNSVTFSADSSQDVAQIIIRDNNGNIVAKTQNSESIQSGKQWSATFTNTKEGKHTYTAQGVFENGYTGDEKPVKFTFTVKQEKLNIFQRINRAIRDFWSGIFRKK